MTFPKYYLGTFYRFVFLIFPPMVMWRHHSGMLVWHDFWGKCLIIWYRRLCSIITCYWTLPFTPITILEGWTFTECLVWRVCIAWSQHAVIIASLWRHKMTSLWRNYEVVFMFTYMIENVVSGIVGLLSHL